MGNMCCPPTGQEPLLAGSTDEVSMHATTKGDELKTSAQLVQEGEYDFKLDISNSSSNVTTVEELKRSILPQLKKRNKVDAAKLSSEWSSYKYEPHDPTPQDEMKIRERIYKNIPQTFECLPEYTWYPENLGEIKGIIKQATRKAKRIRCIGAGYSSSSFYSDDGTWMISSKRLCHPEKIEIFVDKTGQQIITVESGMTVGQVAQYLKVRGLSMPFNTENLNATYGGVVATGAHGSGWTTKTLSDLVHSLEIIDSHCELIKIEGEDLNNVGINLGTLGVIYRISLFVEQTHRVEVQSKMYTIDQVFPRRGNSFGVLTSIIQDNLYNEISWFPFSQDCHVVTFCKTDQPISHDSCPFMDDFEERLIQEVGDFVIHLFTEPTGKKRLHGYGIQGPVTQFFTRTLKRIYETGSAVVLLEDGIHWRKELKRLPSVSMEFALPISTLSNGKPDMSPIRNAFYAVVDSVQNSALSGEYPLNIGCRLRFTQGSNVLLSPARGNEHTCFMEIISVADTATFQEFCGHIAKQWINLVPGSKPQWGTWIHGLDKISPKLQMATELEAFRQARSKLAMDLHNLFSNEYLDKLFNLEFDTHWKAKTADEIVDFDY